MKNPQEVSRTNYRMYKKKKVWVFAATIFAATALAQGGIKADIIPTINTDEATVTNVKTSEVSESSATESSAGMAEETVVDSEETVSSGSDEIQITAEVESSAVQDETATATVTIENDQVDTQIQAQSATVQTAPTSIYEDEDVANWLGVDVSELESTLNKNLIGVASIFHIFAYEAVLNAHTAGNIAVQELTTHNANFGTPNKTDSLPFEVYYIQKFLDGNGIASSFVKADSRTNKAIFGENHNIDVSENRPKLDGQYLDNIDSSEVFQDTVGSTYIDFDVEFAKLKALSEMLAVQGGTQLTNNDLGDQNSRTIDIAQYEVDENNLIIINLDSEVLALDRPLYIQNYNIYGDTANIVINVDAGFDTYKIMSEIYLMDTDGNRVGVGETDVFEGNNLLWNFYRTDGATATSIELGGDDLSRVSTHILLGSVLAVDDTIELTAVHNVKGNIVAKKVVVNAESHRWDLQTVDPESESETPEPETPEPETPEPETPEPETPEPETPEPETPEPETPEPETPEPETPEPETPEPETPEPETPEPETPEPETPEPETPEPETPEPETPEPETPEPETPEPETPEPETPEPETPEPETPEPETPEPETPESETPEPETPEPETPEPETPEPETPEPETPEPETPEPETPEPETPGTETPELVTPDPEVPDPETIEVNDSNPVATQAKAVSVSEKATASQQPAAATLPQTREAQSNKSLFGWVLLGTTALLGLWKKKFRV